MRRRVAASLLAFAAILATSACAQNDTEYGAATAGPTLAPDPSSAPVGSTAGAREVASPEPTEAAASAPGRKKGVCDLFTVEEVTTRLGAAVNDGSAGSEGGVESCTWKVRTPAKLPGWLTGDPVLPHAQGTVTVTRAPAGQARALQRTMLTDAEEVKADTRVDLRDMGTGAFAIGGSVSGVPIWRAMAVRRDIAVSVRLSGYGTLAGEAEVKGFLGDVLTRL